MSSDKLQSDIVSRFDGLLLRHSHVHGEGQHVVEHKGVVQVDVVSETGFLAG